LDRQKASELFDRLKSEELQGWHVTEFIDNGKSAAVYRARKGDVEAAIKVYDSDLVNRFGDAALLERMEREKWLVGCDHPNLVRILDSGVDKKTGNHFLVMEFLKGKSLSNCLWNVTDEEIEIFIAQLASAAEYLESLNLVHRDIKPPNIVITDEDRRLVLLDFGVLRPVGEVGLTDGDGTLFVGTNQYASPEFALRQEDDSPDGWRAIATLKTICPSVVELTYHYRNGPKICRVADGIVGLVGRRLARDLLVKGDLFDAPTADVALSEYEVLVSSRGGASIRSETGSALEVELLPLVSSRFRNSSRGASDVAAERVRELNVPALRKALSDALRALDGPSRSQPPGDGDLFGTDRAEAAKGKRARRKS
jgi:serine/threonine protein kinase